MATWRGQRRGQRLRQIDLTGDETTGANIVRVVLTSSAGPRNGPGFGSPLPPVATFEIHL